MNAEDRRLGSLWASTCPLVDLVCTRFYIHCLSPLDMISFTCAGRDWETKQQAKEIAGRRRGMTDLEAAMSRDYRITLAAEQKAEKACFAHRASLYTDVVMWDLIPRLYRTEAQNAAIFCQLSRLGCGVEEIIASEHKRYPVRLFLAIHHPELIPQMLRETNIYDPFTREFLARNDLRSADGRMRLTFIALLKKTSMSPIESGHAQIRRTLHKLCVQTHTMDLYRVSSLWTHMINK